MFIVKAEVPTDVGPNYHLYVAEHVHVSVSSYGQTHGTSPDFDIELYNASRQAVAPGDEALLDIQFKTLHVGCGLDHYSAVYIMNENGKTLEAVRQRPRATCDTDSLVKPGGIVMRNR